MSPAIEKFATHRHRGHDFYLICQKPSQLHHFIRDLVGRHVHFYRPFGTSFSTRYEWQRLADVADKWEKKDASTSQFIYPKKVYDWYVSADMHTVKNRMPYLRLGAIAIAIIAVPLLLWRVISSFTDPEPAGGQAPAAAAAGSGSTPGQSATSSWNQAGVISGPASVDAWAARWSERIPGLPYSAPAYDQVAKVAAFPKISGCIEIRSRDLNRCTCNSQQGTILPTVTETQCRYWLKHGWFDFTSTASVDDVRRGGSGGSAGPSAAGAGFSLAGSSSASASASPALSGALQ